MKFQETEYGFECLNSNFIAFFGKHNSSLQNLRTAYPYLDWSSVKQVHGDNLVESNLPMTGEIEADAQWSSTSKLSLITRTADCVPVLAYHPGKKTVISIHAGWRGVANRIVPKSFLYLKNLGFTAADWDFFIGPHIMQKSFNIKEDSYDLLKRSTELPTDQWLEKTNDGFRADLLSVVKHQISDVGGDESKIHELVFDTQTDLRFHSFRRDRENSGRQISFISLL